MRVAGEIAKKTLVEFMKVKSNILIEMYETKATLNFFTHKDADAIKNWDDEKAVGVLNYMNTITFDDDGDFCPFCIMHYHCEECEYGKNHGICSLDTSNTYDETRSLFGESILEFIDIYDMMDLKQILTKGYQKIKDLQKDKTTEKDMREFKNGDAVYSLLNGWGTVVEVDDRVVTVNFDNQGNIIGREFHYDGRKNKIDKFPELYFSKEEALEKIKQKTPVKKEAWVDFFLDKETGKWILDNEAKYQDSPKLYNSKEEALRERAKDPDFIFINEPVKIEWYEYE